MRIVFMGTPEFAVPSLNQLIQDGHNIVGVYTCLLYTSDAADE